MILALTLLQLFLPVIPVNGRIRNPGAVYNVFCRDGSPLRFDGTEDVSNNLTVYFTDKGLFYRSTGTIRRDGSPEVEGSANIPQLPKLFNNSSKYYFPHNISAYVFKTSPYLWSFAGYNQDWIGCPTSLCLDGTLDAATQLGNHLMIFRGAYYWYFENRMPTSAITAQSSTEMDGVQYVDAAYELVGSQPIVHVLKDYRVYRSDGTSFRGQLVFWPQPNISACQTEGAHAATSVGAITVVFSATKLCYAAGVGSWNVQNLSYEFHNLDAVFIRNNRLYLLKRWRYFTTGYGTTTVSFNIHSNPGATMQYSFHNIFGCQDSAYAAMGYANRIDYEQKVGPGTEGLPPGEWTGIRNTSSTSTGRDSGPRGTSVATEKEQGLFFPILLAFGISVVIVGVGGPACFYLHKSTKKRRAKQHGKHSTKKGPPKQATKQKLRLRLKSDIQSSSRSSVRSSHSSSTR